MITRQLLSPRAAPFSHGLDWSARFKDESSHYCSEFPGEQLANGRLPGPDGLRRLDAGIHEQRAGVAGRAWRGTGRTCDRGPQCRAWAFHARQATRGWRLRRRRQRYRGRGRLRVMPSASPTVMAMPMQAPVLAAGAHVRTRELRARVSARIDGWRRASRDDRECDCRQRDPAHSLHPVTSLHCRRLYRCFMVRARLEHRTVEGSAT